MVDEIDWGPEVPLVVRKYALQNSIEYNGDGQEGSVLGRVLSERQDLRSRAKSLLELVKLEVIRANKTFRELGSDKVVSELEAIDPGALTREKHQKSENLRDLPGDISEVIVRFAPNPNGPLSIGHSRGVVINSSYAEIYSGKVVLRFDDTDTKVKAPLRNAYDWIREDFEWLAGRPADVEVIASERMPVYLNYAEKMISDGFGYVCRCSAEDFRASRESKSECSCRDRKVDENLEDWEKMNSGIFLEGEAVVRVKTDMTLPNPALRDWPALRIQHSEHPIVADKYKVWPLLDFQSAIEDHEQGVTHIIRGKDLMDSTRKQTLLYNHFGWQYPETLYWGRVKVHEFGGFSTSSMQESINKLDYEGWDDPRLPTIKALRRRGFDSQSIKNMWSEIGLTQKDISISMKTLESLNSTLIDSKCERRSFVAKPVSLEIKTDLKNPQILLPRHPENKILGSREWKFESSILVQSSDLVDGKVRLKDFADIYISDFEAKIESLNRSDNRPIIQWLTKGVAQEATLSIPNEEGVEIIRGVVEGFEIRLGEVYQLERIGFARVDDIVEGVVRMLWLHN